MRRQCAVVLSDLSRDSPAFSGSPTATLSYPFVLSAIGETWMHRHLLMHQNQSGGGSKSHLLPARETQRFGFNDSSISNGIRIKIDPMIYQFQI